jgi:hypothetical protein
MAAFLPTLFMRRASVPRWTRLLGMMNIGASTGIVVSQAYFQYTGERQKALKELDRQRRRRALEFHHIFWNKLLMARFDPLIQQYVRHNGIFRAYHIPADVYQTPDKYGLASAATTEKSADWRSSRDGGKRRSLLQSCPRSRADPRDIGCGRYTERS